MLHRRLKDIISNLDLFLSRSNKDNLGLDKLIEGVLKERGNCKSITKVLFAPGFNISQNFIFHDVVLSSLLYSKGAEIHYCSGHQRLLNAFSFYGDCWTTGNLHSDFNSLNRGELRALYYFSQYSCVHKMAKLITDEEVKDIKNVVYKLTTKEVLDFKIGEISLGHDAENVVRNMNLVSDIKLVDNYQLKIKKSLANCLIYYRFLKKIIKEINPDSIVSHESFYPPWSILAKLSKKYKIPFYNYYIGIRDNSYVYADNEYAMKLDMNNIWNKHRAKPLKKDQKEKIAKILVTREKGDIGHLGQFRSKDERQKNKIIQFSKQKPTAVLYGNVVWDLAALDKEILFHSIREGYVETIKFFINHPQYQLIIKSHPDEENPKIPSTKEKLMTIVKQEIGNLPKNIMLLLPKAAITIYDLFPVSACSIVWTTTAGLESVIHKTPTITLANSHYRDKGFTFDPKSKKEYFDLIDQLMENKVVKDLTFLSDQALKYFYYFYFILNYDYGIPTFVWNNKKVVAKKLEEYFENKQLDKVVYAIINNKKIKTLI